MSIITLTTDFGIKDYSLAAVKGCIFRDLPTAKVVDISHQIKPHNIVEASFIINASYPNFPKNSIHIIGVSAEQTIENKHIVAQIDGHFFIGADNGIFSLIQGNKELEHLVEIEHPKSATSCFPVRDVFVDVAIEIAKGTSLSSIGKRVTHINSWVKNKPNISRENELIGHIVYVDHYGNLVTDISKAFFNQYAQDKRFTLIASSAKISKIYTNYDAIVDFSQPLSQRQRAGKALAIFNSLDLLEIAIYKSNPENGGSAASLLGLDVGDSIKIEIT